MGGGQLTTAKQLFNINRSCYNWLLVYLGSWGSGDVPGIVR